MAGTAVCCPTCWSWSELGKSAACSRCGTPLIYADGRVVGQTAAPATPQTGFASGAQLLSPAAPTTGTPLAPPPAPVAPAAPPAWPPGAPNSAPVAGPAWATRASGVQGLDWLTICRWAYAAYGVLVGIGLVIFGLLVRHVSIPVASPGGGTAYTEVDIGPAFAIVAIIAALLFVLVIWLLQFTVARAILLGLQAVGLLGTLGNTDAFSSGSAFAIWEIVGVVISIGFMVILTMSLIYRRPTGA